MDAWTNDARPERPQEERDADWGLDSFMAELKAIRWYRRAAAACKDRELKAILRDGAKRLLEHAAQTLEWMRVRDAELSKQLRAHLFSEDRAAAISSPPPSAAR